MSEQCVHTNRAVVYVVDPTSRGWVPSAVAGFTRLDIYVHSATGASRVIGRGLEDPTKVVINSNITKETVYTKARDTFHQWSDARGAFGLNFSSAAEADGFAVAFEGAKTPGGGGGAPQPPTPKPAAPPVPPVVASKPPAPPIAPNKPAPPPAPPVKGPPAGGPPPPPPPAKKATPAPSGGGGEPQERGALLNSITGFSKGGLKKTVTVDKSAPIMENKPGAAAAAAAGGGGGGGGGGGAAAPAASSGGGGGGGGGNMMEEMMRKRQQMAAKNAAAAGGGASAAPVAPKPDPPAPTPKAAPTTPTPKASFNKPAPPPGKPAPPPPKQEAAPTPSFAANGNGNGSGSGKDLPEHLQALKEAIMSDVRAELAQLKSEILEALAQR